MSRKFFLWLALKAQSGWWGLQKPLCGSGSTLGWKLACWSAGTHLGDGKSMSIWAALGWWWRGR